MRQTKLFKQDVAIQAILYILQQMGGTCDIHKCHKILYFADNKHLSKYGRSITGDSYIRMDFGPVPTCVYDLFKAVRGDSYFASQVDDIRQNLFHFVNNIDITSTHEPNMDYLSKSDVEMLDKYIAELKDKDFNTVSDASHGYAWSNTRQNGEISVRDRLTELGDSDEYIQFSQIQYRLRDLQAIGIDSTVRILSQTQLFSKQRYALLKFGNGFYRLVQVSFGHGELWCRGFMTEGLSYFRHLPAPLQERK